MSPRKALAVPPPAAGSARRERLVIVGAAALALTSGVMFGICRARAAEALGRLERAADRCACCAQWLPEDADADVRAVFEARAAAPGAGRGGRRPAGTGDEVTR